MLKQPAQQAYVLNPRRKRDLWTYFDEGGHTALGMVYESLESVEKVQLIEAKPKISSSAFNPSP